MKFLRNDPPRAVRAWIGRWAVLAACGLAATVAGAAGVSAIEVPADRDGPALHGLAWTPCDSPAGPLALGPYVVAGVRDCPVAGDRLPLVVLSHGYGGSFLGHHDTAETLADAGFVAVAIDHSGDNHRLRGGPDDSIVALATRTTDIRRLIDYLLRQWPSRDRLAAGQVGFFGFSRGGYTGLVLAGARPDFERLPPLPGSACETAPDGPACASMRRNFRALLAAPLARDDRIRAAVIADPFNAVFDAESLRAVRIPIQLWASTFGGDGVTPDGVAAVRRGLPVTPDWHVAEQAGHFAFLAPCSAAQRDAMAEVCHDGPGFDRAAFHAAFDAQVLAFFRRQLGDGTVAAAGR